MPITLGDRAPDFTLADQTGHNVRLSDVLRQKAVVLFIYPGDLTPGCTIQLCTVRDDWQKFAAAGVAVFGLNHGDQKSHQTFIERHTFPFPLLVDKHKRVAEQYGATRKLLGAKVIRRTVVGIDRDGLIRFYKHGMPKTADILKALNKKNSKEVTD